MLRIEFHMDLDGVLSELDSAITQAESVQFDNALPVDEHRWLMFATVTCVSSATECDIAARLEDASALQLLTSYQYSTNPRSYHVLLFVERTASVLTVITQAGAVPHRLVAEKQQICGTASVRDWAHLKNLAEAIDQSYGSFELLGTTQEDTIGFPLGTDKMKYSLYGKLTDKQIEVLETAYRMGYFEVPQRATSEEIADELDISRSTLSERLRRSQDNLYEVFFGSAR